MLKTRFLHVKVKTINNDRYLIFAVDEEGRLLSPKEWMQLLFIHHRESFLEPCLMLKRQTELKASL